MGTFAKGYPPQNSITSRYHLTNHYYAPKLPHHSFFYMRNLQPSRRIRGPGGVSPSTTTPPQPPHYPLLRCLLLRLVYISTPFLHLRFFYMRNFLYFF